DRACDAVLREEVGLEVPYLQQGRHHVSPHMRRAMRGSSLSRSPSPTRLTESTTSASARPGQNTVQGARARYTRLEAIILPQVGISGGVPAPRKDRAASIRMADAQM